MSKYTPGPWMAEQHQDDLCIFRSAPSKLCVAAMHNALPGPETKANARLIASAPDMVEVLLDLREKFENECDVVDGPNGEPRPNESMRWLQAIDDVLEKAGAR